MASTDARPVPIKNTAYRHYYPLRLTTGALVATATAMDTEVSKDGGTFADATNEWTEIGATGVGYIDLTSTEMNADSVILKTTYTNTNNMTAVEVLFPSETGDIDVDVTAWNGTAVVSPDTAGYPKVTVKSGTGTGELSITSGVVQADAAKEAGLALVLGTAQAGAASTITLANGTTNNQAAAGDIIELTGGATSAGPSGVIASLAGGGTATPIATMVQAWNGTNPTVGTTYRIRKVGGIVPALVTDLASAAQAAAIDAKLPSSLSSSGNLKADVKEINDAEVIGTGISGDKWRGS